MHASESDLSSLNELNVTPTEPKFFEGNVDEVTSASVRGWVWTPSRPAQRHTIRVYADSALVAEVLANEFREDLLMAEKGDGSYSFYVMLPYAIPSGAEIRVEVGDSNFKLGKSVQLRELKYSFHQTPRRLAILAKAARVLSLPLFLPLHAAVRALLVRVFVPWLARSVNGKLEVRHSAVSARSYHMLYSDLDLDLVLPEDEIDRASESLKKIDQWRRLFPFIGEVETFTANEISDRDWAKNETDGWYERVRKVRKAVWLAEQKTASLYHEQKRLRALEKCVGRVNPSETKLAHIQRPLLSMIQDLEREFQSVDFEPIHLSVVESDYLGFCLSDTNETHVHRPTVQLSTRLIWILLALIPFDFDSNSAEQTVLNRIRENRDVLRVWRGFLRTEFLITQAFNRSSGFTDRKILERNMKLKRRLETP